MSRATIAVSVVVPTRDRPTRLRWLLNALEQQTLDADRFEVILVNGSRNDDTSQLIADHALTHAGVVKEIQTGLDPLPTQRERGWRAAQAPLIVFTDDDCRPAPEWLERALEAAAESPDAVLQGQTLPDPDEVALLGMAPHARTQNIVPPTVWAQTCNIAYPRTVLKQIDGFDLAMPSNFAGDDTDLALRAIEAGAPYRGVPEMLTYHAVLDGSLLERLRSSLRWGDLPYLFKRHPQLREELPLWIFWTRRHALLPLALAGFSLQRRTRLAILLAVPWAAHAAPDHTTSPRGRIRSVMELPSQAVIDVVEIVSLIRGSVRHGTVLL